jgi:hypothetical protein
MARTQIKTTINGAEEIKKTYERREGRFLGIFKTTWWEEVASEHIGNDIHIETDREIRQIYLNGKPLTTN